MNTLILSGQTVTIAVGETYVLRTDEVMVNGVIYRKADLEIALSQNDALADDEVVLVGITKRDGTKNLPADLSPFAGWTINITAQTVLATCVEGISAGIRE